MPDYDFHQLSPNDFEKLARDLLQEHLKVTLESFKSGKDGGIDFRFTESGGDAIVQCKHYQKTGLSGLLRDLPKEAAKPNVKAAKRYILVTSVPLSDHNKSSIIAA